MSLELDLKSVIKDVPDFPKPGIVFKDICPLLADAELMKRCVKEFATFAKTLNVHYVVGAESRGFLFGVPLALELGLPFVPARKKGKLPGKVVAESYQLEYGVDHIEMQFDAIQSGKNYLVIDDVIATGGTAAAIGKLIHKHGGKVPGFAFLIELGFLNGSAFLKEQCGDAKVVSLYKV